MKIEYQSLLFEAQKILYSQEEKNILHGSQGEKMQKILATVVLYGEALGAEKLVDINGYGHFVITYAIPGIAPSMEMLVDFAASGLKAKYPFTLDPKPPLDFENWFLSAGQIKTLEQMYEDQERYDEICADYKNFITGLNIPDINFIPIVRYDFVSL